MANPAFYDFFRKIVLAPDGVTIEADSTTDTVTITRGNGVAFNPNASTDSFEIDVDYQLYVPVGTTDIRLEDVNNNTRDVTITGGTNIVVSRNSSNELVISSPVSGGGAGVDLQTITDLGANTTNQITISGDPVLTDKTGFTHINLVADDSTVRVVNPDETISIQGGGDITTSSDAEGAITITYNTPENLSEFTNDVGYLTATDQYKFSVSADDSTLREIGTDESIKFIGGGDIATSSDAEGNITISYTAPVNLSELTNDVGYLTSFDQYKFSVGADDSTLREVGNDESVKFIGGGDIATTSDAEGNITITYNQPTTISSFSNDAGYYSEGDTFVGDLKGSVFADDSGTLVDAVAGKIVGEVETTTVNATFIVAKDTTVDVITGSGGTFGGNFGTVQYQDSVMTVGHDTLVQIGGTGATNIGVNGQATSFASGSTINFNNATISGTNFATETYVDNSISNLIDSAPGALDTLNELANAINDDQNFAATVSNQFTDVNNKLTNLIYIGADDSTLRQVSQGESILIQGGGDVSTTSDSEGNITVSFSQDFAFGSITGTPTTLSGYGITDAATSAQGALADSAVQPGDLAAVATSGDYNDLSNLPNIADAYHWNIASDDSTTVEVSNRETVKISGANTISTSVDAEGNLTITGPANLSDLNNDLGFAVNALVSGDNISELVNDAGYVTSATVFSFNITGDDSTVRTVEAQETIQIIGGGDITTASDADGNITVSFTQDTAFGSLTGTPTTLSGYGITDAATSAQGALADSAVQPGDNVSDLTNDVNYTTVTYLANNTVKLGKLNVNDNYNLPSYKGLANQLLSVQYDLTNYDTVSVFGGFSANFFDGNSQTVGTPSSNSEDGSVSFWIRVRENTASHKTVLDLGEWEITCNSLALYLHDKAGSYTQLTGALTLNTFTYVLISFGGGSAIQWIVQSYYATSGSAGRYVRTPVLKSSTEMLDGSAVVAGGTLAFNLDDLHIVSTYQTDPTTSVSVPTTEATAVGATLLLDNFNDAPLLDELQWVNGVFAIGADDSTMRELSYGETIRIVGGTNITTTSSDEGDITITNDITALSQLSNDTNFATQGYVNTAVADLVDSAPSTLDTLNELARALNDDANFASTITTSVATKADKTNLFGIGADDSTVRPIDATESIFILGGTNITTASDAEGNITVNAPSAISAFTNDQGYLTAETDTLDSVAGRGATTTTTLNTGILQPDSDSTYTLGADGARWSTTFSDNIVIDGKLRNGNTSWDTDPRILVKQSDTEVWLETNVNSTSGSVLGFYKTRGTTSAETAAQDGDNIFEIYGRGLEPGTINQGSNIVLSDWDTVGSISLDIDGADASSLGGAFTISTKPVGGSNTERLKISSAGSITINQAYTIPTADGSANQVLMTDAAGTVSFDYVDYTDVTNTPTAVSTFTNDANYVAQGDNITVLNNNANFVAQGDNVSDLANDAGYYSAGSNMIGDLTGSVFADDSTTLIDGVEGLMLGRHVLPSYTTAAANSISDKKIGEIIYVSDGDNGLPCIAVYDGLSFKRLGLGATISS